MRYIILSLFCCFAPGLWSQPYLSIEEVGRIEEVGVHSGVAVAVDDHWLFIGGRINGLHGFRPPLAFESNGVNDQVIVVAENLKDVWTLSMKELPDSIREPLTSSNMQYTMKGDQLYILGGYGWKEKADDFVTFNTLIDVNAKELVQAVKTEGEWPAFNLKRDTRFEVTGGYLTHSGDTFNIVFGHSFFGRYARNSQSKFFKQEYTNEIRRFVLAEESLMPGFLEPLRDTANFHRRDYNLVPQMGRGGTKMYTAFSGVFRYTENLPFYTPVEIRPMGTEHKPDFEQKYAHYHSAVMPVWDGENGDMHTFFFGGMAEYYIDSATQETVQDTLVPFVKTISRVTRNKSGEYSEQVLPIKMPGFLGSNMWFFPQDDKTHRVGDMIDLFTVEGKTLVGHLVGGIVSPYENISPIDASISGPNKRVYAVYLSDEPIGFSELPAQEQTLEFGLFPNPSAGQVFIKVEGGQGKPFRVDILSVSGKLVKSWEGTGSKTLVWSPGEIRKGVYTVRLSIDGLENEKKLVWE